jgi:hypothetical protein
VAARWAATLDRELVVLTMAAGDDVGSAASQVEAIAARARELAPGARGEVIEDPMGVASGVQQHLAHHDVALVVLAAPRRTGVARLRRGATAAEIVRRSTAPAVVVPVASDEEEPRRRDHAAVVVALLVAAVLLLAVGLATRSPVAWLAGAGAFLAAFVVDDDGVAR